MSKKVEQNMPLKVVENSEEAVSNSKTETPVTIYDITMANMTPEILADLGVHLVSVNNRDLFWLTSVGQLYPFNNRNQAFEAELAWLNSKVNN